MDYNIVNNITIGNNSQGNQIYQGIKGDVNNNSTNQTNTGSIGGDMVGGDKTTN